MSNLCGIITKSGTKCRRTKYSCPDHNRRLERCMGITAKNTQCKNEKGKCQFHDHREKRKVENEESREPKRQCKESIPVIPSPPERKKRKLDEEIILPLKRQNVSTVLFSPRRPPQVRQASFEKSRPKLVLTEKRYENFATLESEWHFNPIYNYFFTHICNRKLCTSDCKNVIPCSCSGCNSTIAEVCYLPLNDSNGHCVHCTCVECVCPARKSKGLYSQDIPDNCGKCYTCNKLFVNI